MHCGFVLRHETPQGYDEYYLRLILYVSGKGAVEYTDHFANVEISHGGQLYNDKKRS
jgi:hypothetical protein